MEKLQRLCIIWLNIETVALIVKSLIIRVDHQGFF